LAASVWVSGALDSDTSVLFWSELCWSVWAGLEPAILEFRCANWSQSPNQDSPNGNGRNMYTYGSESLPHHI